MAFEISTVTVAIVALLVSIGTFMFSMWQWIRTRKSEQFKIAREIMDKVEADHRKLFQFTPGNRYPFLPDEEKENFVYEFTQYLGFMQLNIRYLSYLVEKKEIKNKHVLNYYRDGVIQLLDYINSQYEWVEGKPERRIMDKWPGYHAEIPSLKKVWEHERIPRLKKISKRFKKLWKHERKA
jgi:hypothetical protein